MEVSSLTLISHPLCPFVQRVAIVLSEKNILFQRVNVDLHAKPTWFVAISPTGKVPLLKVQQYNGEESVLFESIAICEYVEEMDVSPALLPINSLSRAHHRAWIEFASAMLTDAWGFLTATERETASMKGKALQEKLERFEAEMGSGPYFAGVEFSMIDAVVAPIFRYFDVLDVAMLNQRFFNKLPKISQWRRALAQRPSVKAAVSYDYGDRFRKHLQQEQALLAIQ